MSSASKPDSHSRGYATVTPYLTIRGAADAIAFYARAFGAVELSRMQGPGGKLMHAEIKIGDSILMMSDEFPEMGGKGGPQTLGGTTVAMCITVEGDIDAAYARAVEAGATPTMPLADMFWGDRYGQLVDPFGHAWAMTKQVEVLSSEEIERRAAAAFSGPKP
ncbi:VOC family protein [Chondromyces apiculatus]|uniref:Glyoxalase/bleomycin resistance protein/dioxygenase n=1 Tax=Chondromyces apiculatus DSM 436 TaxID=1192034 RepID=A0A017TDU7_9BACT|nr:VOC family protein [Chondromyces apiculatus]EYF06791.1 Glyoxalase/bleomycin resistance protein/dioxygenase [Chondromyces apiculatus DSM 436]